MALPKIEFPTYSMILPSTGKKIQYRPYTVKEEKNILIAKETADGDNLISSIRDLLEACTLGKIDIDSLTTFDFEMLFMHIRGKAVGEKVSLNIRCEDDACAEYTQVGIDMSTAKIKGEIKSRSKI